MTKKNLIWQENSFFFLLEKLLSVLGARNCTLYLQNCAYEVSLGEVAPCY